VNLQFDHDKLPKQWLHPADRAITNDEDNTQEDPTHINIYTDGSKSEQGVGAGIAIIRAGTTTVELMYKMYTRCTGGNIRNTQGGGIRTNSLGKRLRHSNNSVYRSQDVTGITKQHK